MKDFNLAIEWEISSGDLDIATETLELLEMATSKEQMIPLTEETIEGHHIRVLAWNLGRLAGYAAINAPYDFQDSAGEHHDALELGGAVVLPDFRGKGLASTMLQKRVDILEQSDEIINGTRAVVFTNEKSRGYVQRGGFVPLAAGEALPKAAFELCDTCTHCPLDIRPVDDPTQCCDYDGILVREIVK